MGSPNIFTNPAGTAFNNLGVGVIGGLGGLAGAFPTPTSINGSGSSQTSGTQTTNQTGTSSSTSMPVISPELQALLNSLFQKFGSISTPTAGQLAGQQTANINQSFDAANKNLNEDLASRGLSTSPVAASLSTGLQNQRLAQINNMQLQIPQLLQQLQLQNLTGGINLASSIPRGSTTTGTTTQGGTTSTSQNTNTQQNQTSQAGGGLGGFFGGLGAILASL